MDAIMFAINEKAIVASESMNQYRNDSEKYNFWRGQYLAFTEIYSLLNNANELSEKYLENL